MESDLDLTQVGAFFAGAVAVLWEQELNTTSLTLAADSEPETEDFLQLQSSLVDDPQDQAADVYGPCVVDQQGACVYETPRWMIINPTQLRFCWPERAARMLDCDEHRIDLPEKMVALVCQWLTNYVGADDSPERHL